MDDAVVPHNDKDNNNNGELIEGSVQLVGNVATNSHTVVGDNFEEKVVRAVRCQINVRKNGEMEVVVPGDEEMSRKLQNILHQRLPQGLPQNASATLGIPPSANKEVKMSNLNTFDELESLENNLKDLMIKHKMKENIHRLGGKTGQDAIRRNLRHLMTDSLASKFSWAGREGKRSFKELTLAPILMDTILDSHSAATAYHLEIAIKSWLKQAPHRLDKSSKN